jgi:hypothetical protein
VPEEPIPSNAPYNRTRGVAAPRLELFDRRWPGATMFRRYYERADGDYVGTTDRILQWASCKWGFDEDLTRARAVTESSWDQRTAGDEGRSRGILQVKCWGAGTPHDYTAPYCLTSTAYNADYALAWLRACYDGGFAEVGWLPEASRGDLWGCVGLWYSGELHRGDESYVASVRRNLAERAWELYFVHPVPTPAG